MVLFFATTFHGGKELEGWYLTLTYDISGVEPMGWIS